MRDVTVSAFLQAVDDHNILIRDVIIVGSFVYGQPLDTGEVWRAPI